MPHVISSTLAALLISRVKLFWFYPVLFCLPCMKLVIYVVSTSYQSLGKILRRVLLLLHYSVKTRNTFSNVLTRCKLEGFQLGTDISLTSWFWVSLQLDCSVRKAGRCSSWLVPPPRHLHHRHCDLWAGQEVKSQKFSLKMSVYLWWSKWFNILILKLQTDFHIIQWSKNRCSSTIRILHGQLWV